MGQPRGLWQKETTEIVQQHHLKTCFYIFPSKEVNPTSPRSPPLQVSPADLLEDVVSADILDVFLYDRANPILLCQLLLQPLHQVLVVVPNVGLQTEESQSSTGPGGHPEFRYLEGSLRTLAQCKTLAHDSLLLFTLQNKEPTGLRPGASGVLSEELSPRA